MLHQRQRLQSTRRLSVRKHSYYTSRRRKSNEANLSMFSNAAYTQCHDRGETNTFKEECHVQHCQTNISALGDTGTAKHESTSKVEHENYTRLHVSHDCYAKISKRGVTTAGNAPDPLNLPMAKHPCAIARNLAPSADDVSPRVSVT